MTPGRAARVCVGLIGLAGAARAGTFAADGKFAFDAKAVATADFEAYPDGVDPTMAGYELIDEPTALSGTKAIKLGPYQGGGVTLDVPAGDASYVARAWVKGDAFADVEVSYDDQSIAPVLSQLWPTGRVTSDGWIELESAEFSVEQARGPKVSLGFFGANGVVADAGELLPAGVFRAARTCAGVKDTTSCRADEICSNRRCVDGRGFLPPIPKGQQGELADWLESRLTALFGPYSNRKLHLPAALAKLAVMKTTSDRAAYWRAFTGAVSRLRDSHTSTFATWQFTYDAPGGIPLNACFIAGHADLQEATAPSPTRPHVLVSHAGQIGSWGLHPGDRIVAVDGEDPIDWVRALESRRGSAPEVNDPESVAAFLEPLGRYIGSMAQTVTLVRCTAASGVCGPEVTVKVADQEVPTEPLDRFNCDNRPRYHVDGVPPSHDVGDRAYAGLALESNANERVYGMVWDSLLGGPGSKVKKDISAAVSSWRDEGARGVILDHRSGNGGTGDTGVPILSFATPPHVDVAFVWRTHANEEGPVDAEAGLALFTKNKGSGVWPTKSGSSSAMTDVRVAMLLTRDVSASDYLPNSMKGAAPNVKLFGPNPTNGAFSTFLGGQYWTGLSFQLACGDTIAGATGEALCGKGVRPDFYVLPKQSQLMQGKDPVYDAALAWVREGLAP